MLYIPVMVNNHPIKAFVDSGAQATVMSPACAEACNIMRLIDKRFSGIARGVGTAKILGRVHSAEIIIGDHSMDCSFTVMEGKDVDLLLGLDMLKRHQAIIDLAKGALVIKNVEVKFLGEADIPKYEESLLNEPTVAGPSGMQTGARSGAVTMSSETVQGGPSTARSSALAHTGSGAQTSTSPSSFPPEDIAKLMDMGFTREQAIQGLEAAGGNLDVAAGILL
jgi:DNA damage-inducible protein 1